MRYLYTNPDIDPRNQNILMDKIILVSEDIIS